MSPFGDDFFSEIEKAFFSTGARNSSYGSVIKGESEERVIDYIEEKEEIYFVFELPGFNEKDLEVSLRGDKLKVLASKKDFSGIKNYLRNKLSEDIVFQKTIPVKVKKDFKKNFKNGVLEVKFFRK